eukprot:COSAG05_NODE_1397_length_4981_cov_8.111020_5_plen_30_part_00
MYILVHTGTVVPVPVLDLARVGIPSRTGK